MKWKMSPEDEGSYCRRRVILVTLTFISLIQHICCDVVIPPLLTVQPRSELFVLHQDVMLTCQASGHPTPRYEWTLDGVRLDVESSRYQFTGGDLSIHEANIRDEGTYHCWASNEGGTDRSGPSNLTLAFQLPFPIQEYDSRLLERGDSVSLACHPPNSQPPPNVVWVRTADDNVVTPIELSERMITDLEGSLHILNVVSEDAGTYMCTSLNHVTRGTVQDSPIRLLVNTGSSPSNRQVSVRWRSKETITALTGSTLRLQCIVDGNPPPVISWEYVGAPMPAGRWQTTSWGTILEISDLDLLDTGMYECVAFNEISLRPVTVRMQVTVEDTPKFTVVPVSINATRGQHVLLECGATGVPQPDISWYFNGEDAIDTRRVVYVSDHSTDGATVSRLNITNIVVDDTMVVGCTANNKHGQVYASSYISVGGQQQNIPVVASAGASTTFGIWAIIHTVAGVLLA